jgi:hypothetical protein
MFRLVIFILSATLLSFFLLWLLIVYLVFDFNEMRTNFLFIIFSRFLFALRLCVVVCVFMKHAD